MPRGKRRAAVIAVPVLALALVGATAYAVTSGEDTPPPQTAMVGRSTVREVVEAAGQVVARSAATVSSPAGGTVAQLRVADGARVEQGQVLLRISSPSAESRLQQAKKADAELVRSMPTATLGVPASARTQAAAAAKAAADGFTQAKAAAAAIPDAATRAQALATVTSAQAQYELAQRTAQDSLDQLNAGAGTLSQAASALVGAQRLQTRAAIEVAQSTVDSLVVRAPVAGVVTYGAPGAGSGGAGLDAALSALPSSISDQASSLLGSVGGAAGGSAGAPGTPVVAEGVPVESGSALLTITDDSDVSLTAEVDETDILLVRRGIRAGVELDAVPGATYQAAVSSVEANPASSSAGSVSYRVRLSLGDGTLADGSDAPMPRPGMSAVVDLRVRTAKQAVSVPATAVFRVQDRDAVWVAEGRLLRQRLVTLGAQGEDLVQVISGVKPGDRVVVSGADRVRDGQRL